ncbi:MAG: hypothetical protein R3C12_17815 [Planctomycetaceae bacterium]
MALATSCLTARFLKVAFFGMQVAIDITGDAREAEVFSNPGETALKRI